MVTTISVRTNERTGGQPENMVFSPTLSDGEVIKREIRKNYSQNIMVVRCRYSEGGDHNYIASIILVDLEEASTHKSAKAHTGTVSCTSRP